MYNNKIKLSNGVLVPQLGLGTWFITGDDAKNAVKNAISLGYRHIDTAEAYGNEYEVGLGIKESGIKREDIFIQTKLHAEVKSYEAAKAEIEDSLKKLCVSYIDLMIIHSPQPWANFRDGNHYEDGNLEAWRALSEYYKAGKIRAIGVSNFELIDYCKKHDIVVEAYSPIAHGTLLNNKVVKEMALKYNVSIAKLCIRYTLQLGLISLPKTANYEHMKENGNVDFEISDSDMKLLCEINKIDSYGDANIFPCYAKQM